MAHRRPIFALAVIAASSLARCSPDPLAITVSPPAGIEYIAVLLETSDGSLAGSTGILRFLPGTPIRGLYQRRTPQVARVRVAGWSSAELADVIDAAGSRLSTARVTKAGPFDPPLPTPSWLGSGVVQGAQANVTDDRIEIAASEAGLLEWQAAPGASTR